MFDRLRSHLHRHRHAGAAQRPRFAHDRHPHPAEDGGPGHPHGPKHGGKHHDAKHAEHTHHDHPHRGPKHHRDSPAGRLGRFFAHGDLRLVILHLIAEKPRHGYEIIKAIEERVGGAYSPSPGVIYPTLTLLEETGHVGASTEGPRRLYRITDEGLAYLAANQTMRDALLARMDEAARTHGDGPAPQILRAMENLKLALRLRLSRGKPDAAAVNAIAAALDGAATAVEQI